MKLLLLTEQTIDDAKNEAAGADEGGHYPVLRHDRIAANQRPVVRRDASLPVPGRSDPVRSIGEHIET